MEFHDYLKTMVETEASDLYLTVARPTMYRIDGKICPIGEHSFKPDEIEAIAKSIMNERQVKEFAETLEMNMAVSLPGVSRFRVNIFRQRGSVGIVIRRVKADVETLEELGMPPVLKDIAMTKRGLVLVVGATGSGKSTTQAAMVDHRNSIESGHIITIEDPIEFVHRHKKSIVTQREVGFDTHSFQAALKNTLRHSRYRNHGSSGYLRRNRPPVFGDAAFKQCEPSHRAYHEFLSARASCANLLAAVFKSARHHLAATRSDRGR
jgi:twitching motility protein PilU